MKDKNVKNNSWAVQFYCDGEWLTEKWFRDKTEALNYSREAEKTHGIKYRIEADYLSILKKKNCTGLLKGENDAETSYTTNI